MGLNRNPHLILIDYLRIFAVAAVIYEHIFHGETLGYLGVDVFFVISGFVFMHTFGRKEISFSAVKLYWYKRFRRLAPPLLFTAILVGVVSFFVHLPGDFSNTLESISALLLLNANHYFLITQDYFAGDARYVPMLHTWSLSVEEQFYIAFPIIFFLSRGSIKRVVFPLIVISFVCSTWFSDSIAFYTMLARAFEFLAGVLAYGLRAKRPDWKLFGAVSLLISIVIFFSPEFSELVSNPLLVVLITSYILTYSNTVHHRDSQLSRSIRRFGLSTYSIYLVHQPLLSFYRYRYGEVDSNLEIFLLVVAILVFGFVVERYAPVLLRIHRSKSTEKIDKGPIFLYLLITLIILSATLINRAGVFQPSRSSDDSFFQPNYGLSSDCISNELAVEFCLREGVETIFWGDSYAMHVAGSVVQEDLTAYGQVTTSSCLPMFGIAKTNRSVPVERSVECLQKNAQFLNWLDSDEADSVSTVVLSGVFDLNETSSFVMDTASQSVMRFSTQQTLEYFQATIVTLNDMGVRPIVVLPTPTSGENIGACLKRKIAFQLDDLSCDFEPIEKNGFVKGILAIDHLSVFDPASVTCSEQECSSVMNNIPLYIDDGHITQRGSSLVFPMRQILEMQ